MEPNRRRPLTDKEQKLMQAISHQLGLNKGTRQAAMRDQDRQRAMDKAAVYRGQLEAALQDQRAIDEAERKRQAAEELQHLSGVYDCRVARMGEAHLEAVHYMQQQHRTRLEQESRHAELNRWQTQRSQAALAAAKAQQDAAKAQPQQHQRRRAEILRTERDKAQAFASEQVDRVQTQKRRQEDLARQELERRKRATAVPGLDFRSTRLHEGQSATAAVVAVPGMPFHPAIPPPLLPDPVESAEEYQHRIQIEKRKRELAQLERDARAKQRFQAAQAKLQADAQRRAVEAELAELAAQRLQAKKQQLEASRLQLQDRRKQQELQRVFEENFLLGGVADADDDLAPRALPLFLKSASEIRATSRSADRLGGAQRAAGAALPPEKAVPPTALAGVPQWSRGRTAPLGRLGSPPQRWPLQPEPPSRGEVGVQTDPQPDADSHLTSAQPPTASTAPPAQPAPVQPAPAHTGADGETATLRRREAWPEPQPAASSATVPLLPDADTRGLTGVQAPAPAPLAPGSAQAGDGAEGPALDELSDNDALDQWGEEEVDRELARMRRELGLEDIDMRSSAASSIASGVSVPTFLGEAAERRAVRQAGADVAAAAASAAAAAAAATRARAAALAAAVAAEAQALKAATAANTAAATTGQPGIRAEGRAAVQKTRPAPSSQPPALARGAGAATPITAAPANVRHGKFSTASGTPGAASTSSPAETLDSSILRLLNTPTTTATRTSTPSATPDGEATVQAAARDGPSAAGGASAAAHLGRSVPQTPGSGPKGGVSSSDLDLDEVLLLTSLDWEELEGLASSGRRRDASDERTAARVAFSAAAAANVGAAWGAGALGCLGTLGVVGSASSSPGGSSLLSSVSGISNGSVRRLVAQGILPPEIAALLASTPPTVSNATGLHVAGFRAEGDGGALGYEGRPAQSHILAVASPVPSSSLSGISALLAATGGVPDHIGTRASDRLSGTSFGSAAAASLSSLSANSTVLGVSAGTAAAAGAAPRLIGPDAAAGASSTQPPHGQGLATGPTATGQRATPAPHGLFTIPEGRPVAQAPQPGAQPLADAASSMPSAPSSFSSCSSSSSAAAAATPGEKHGGDEPKVPAVASAPAGVARGPHPQLGLPEPVRVTLADLSRDLLATAAGQRGRTKAAHSPSGRPTRPGPLFISSAPDAMQLLKPPPMLHPPQVLQPPHWAGSDQNLPRPNDTLLSATPSLSSLSSSLAALVGRAAATGAGNRPHAGSAGAGAPAAPSFRSGFHSDPSSSLSSLGFSQLMQEGMAAAPGPDARASVAGASPAPLPGWLTAAMDSPGTPLMRSSTTSTSAPPSVSPVPHSPYQLYDDESRRLAELMASISASLKQSAEAVSRAGSSRSGTGGRACGGPPVASAAGGSTPSCTGSTGLSVGEAAAAASVPPESPSLSLSSLSSSVFSATLAQALATAAGAAGGGGPAPATGADGAAPGALPSRSGSADRPQGLGPGGAGPVATAGAIAAVEAGGAVAEASADVGVRTLADRPSTSVSEQAQSLSGAASSLLVALTPSYSTLSPPPSLFRADSDANTNTRAVPVAAASAPSSLSPSLPSPPTPVSPSPTGSSFATEPPSTVSPESSQGARRAAGLAPRRLMDEEPVPAAAAAVAARQQPAQEPARALPLPLPSAGGSGEMLRVAEAIAGLLGGKGDASRPQHRTAPGQQELHPATGGAEGAGAFGDDCFEGLAPEDCIPSSSVTMPVSGDPIPYADAGFALASPSLSSGGSGDDPGPGSSRYGGGGGGMWASLTGQSLEDALAGLASPEGGFSYEDLLRSSLAPSSSSLLTSDLHSEPSSAQPAAAAPVRSSDAEAGVPGAPVGAQPASGLASGLERPAAAAAASRYSRQLAQTASELELEGSGLFANVEAVAEQMEHQCGEGQRSTPIAPLSEGEEHGAKLVGADGAALLDTALSSRRSSSAGPAASHDMGETQGSAWQGEASRLTLATSGAEAAEDEGRDVLSSLRMASGDLLSEVDAVLREASAPSEPLGLAPLASASPPSSPPAPTPPVAELPGARPSSEPGAVPGVTMTSAPEAGLGVHPDLDPNTGFGVRASSDSDEFGSVMAGLLRDIHRGLAAMQQADARVAASRELQHPQLRTGGAVSALPVEECGDEARQWDELGSTAGRLSGRSIAAVPAGGALGRAAAGPPEEATGFAEAGVDLAAKGSFTSTLDAGSHDDVAWWPPHGDRCSSQAAVAGAAPTTGAADGFPAGSTPAREVGDERVLPCSAPPEPIEGGEVLGAWLPGTSPPPRQPQTKQRLEEPQLPPGMRSVLSMPSFSRGFADAPAPSPHKSPPFPRTVCGLGGGSPQRPADATQWQQSSEAQLAESAPVNAVESIAATALPPASHPPVLPQSASGGAYSFLQTPRASLAGHRNPPSVRSEANSEPSPHPSPSSSSSSPAPPTVSSLDSAADALAYDFPPRSLLGSPAPSNSSDGAGSAGDDEAPVSAATRGDEGGRDGLAAGPAEAAEALQRGAAGTGVGIECDWAPLPIQFEPSQPETAVPIEVELEPWRGAWDPPATAPEAEQPTQLDVAGWAARQLAEATAEVAAVGEHGPGGQPPGGSPRGSSGLSGGSLNAQTPPPSRRRPALDLRIPGEGESTASPSPVRSPAELLAARRRSGGGSGGGSANAYSGGLTEEQLAGLLSWTVGALFASPGAACAGSDEQSVAGGELGAG